MGGAGCGCGCRKRENVAEVKEVRDVKEFKNVENRGFENRGFENGGLENRGLENRGFEGGCGGFEGGCGCERRQNYEADNVKSFKKDYVKDVAVGPCGGHFKEEAKVESFQKNHVRADGFGEGFVGEGFVADGIRGDGIRGEGFYGGPGYGYGPGPWRNGIVDANSFCDSSPCCILNSCRGRYSSKAYYIRHHRLIDYPRECFRWGPERGCCNVPINPFGHGIRPIDFLPNSTNYIGADGFW